MSLRSAVNFRSVVRKLSIRGFCVCSGGGGLYVRARWAWHSNLTKILRTYSVSYFNLGGLELFGAARPTKIPRGDGTGELVSFFLTQERKECHCEIYWNYLFFPNWHFFTFILSKYISNPKSKKDWFLDSNTEGFESIGFNIPLHASLVPTSFHESQHTHWLSRMPSIVSIYSSMLAASCVLLNRIDCYVWIRRNNVWLFVFEMHLIKT